MKNTVNINFLIEQLILLEKNGATEVELKGSISIKSKNGFLTLSTESETNIDK